MRIFKEPADIIMNDEDIKEKSKQPETEEIQAIKTSEFMQETIKQRPINKKKLMRRLLTSVVMAVVMGLVACVTFVVLEPLISKRINPEEEEEPVEQIIFVEEPVEEETLPEDMIADESELMPQPVIPENEPLSDEQIAQVLSNLKLGVDDYLSLNQAMMSGVRKISASVVDVIGIKQDLDWFENEYENEHIISGVIIADNGRELLILANINQMSDYDSLEVRFDDNINTGAKIKARDIRTGFAVIAVQKSELDTETKSRAVPIELGTSSSRNLSGTPIVAVGRPLGNVSSVCIGTVTSNGLQIDYTDASYSCLTTDIYGSQQASGILVNLKGQLIGIIDMTHNSADIGNLISGLGITDIRKLIESMSNGREIPYIGIHGKDVSEDISSRLEIPQGVYITGLEMDSPMLEAGVQGGDIIVRFNDVEIKNYKELNNLLLDLEPEASADIEIMRRSPEGYSKMEMTVVLEHQSGS